MLFGDHGTFDLKWFALFVLRAKGSLYVSIRVAGRLSIVKFLEFQQLLLDFLLILLILNLATRRKLTYGS